MTETTIIRIGMHDTAWHDRFYRHVANVFQGIDFSRWADLGGWSGGYEVLAAVEGDELVASIGVTRMIFSYAGNEGSLPVPVEGLQLGAVATRHDRRGEGHARRLMESVLALADGTGAPVLLFANPSVIDFYPKFGFRRLLPQRLSLAVECRPGHSNPALRLDPASGADRRLLARLCGSSPGHGGALSAKPDQSLLLWYLCNGLTNGYMLEDGKSVAFAVQEQDRLTLQDWIGAPPKNLREALAFVLSAPIKAIEFGFLPPQSWLPQPLAIEDDHRSFMFWRGGDLPPGPLCFPALMHT